MGETVPFLIAFLAGLGTTPAAAWLGRRIGFLDTPVRTEATPPGGPLKIHRDAVPLLGGAAVIAAALFAVGLGGGGLGAATVAGILLALAVGIVDDVRPLGTGPRVVMQLAAGACLVPDVLERSGGGVLLAAVVILLVFVCANAVNLVDGQDGLAGGLAAIACLGLVVLGDTSGSAAATAPGLALSGALAAFLIWNRPPARIFLGDGGAYAVGTMLVAVAAAAAADGEIEVLLGAAAAWRSSCSSSSSRSAGGSAPAA
jgi:UDP-GlcNAc:undecaprenyl-phosphate GlcNAc-1-phosphate transferase